MVDAVGAAAFVDEDALVEEELLETGLVELLAGLVEEETFEEDFELTFEDDAELTFEDDLELIFEEDFELTFDELLETFAEVFKEDVEARLDVLTVVVLALLLL
jgi:hypothetical protein